MGQDKSTRLGIYFNKKSINRAEVARKTGISTSRLNQLSNNSDTQLKAHELYLISLAIGVEMNEISKELFNNLELRK
ncbi:helix-turn-helix domain-containing protein [Pedobacter sp. AK017]|uniref:helix-turn-helix domain-containing protein n=1 Tax=Pedobacter sp. AK017 TaxID=2723073 RepID=UPI0016102B54